MEPLTLATLTAAVTVLATEVGKGAAAEAGKSAWGKIKSLFKWSAEPALRLPMYDVRDGSAIRSWAIKVNPLNGGLREIGD